MTPPDYLLPWLTEQGFLTKKLQQLTGDAQLQVLAQTWTLSGWWDKYILNLDREMVLQRNILMSSHHKPCWYARTILPLKTFNADQELFGRLQYQLLGNILFESNVVTRNSFNYYAIDHNNLEYHWMDEKLHQNAKCLWARRSVFLVHDSYPLYLIEIFLPGMSS